MLRISVACLFGVGFVGAAFLLVRAQGPQGEAKKATAKEIARLIDDLDANDFGTRERATKELLALEGQALEPLKKALAGNRSPEFTARARNILRSLAIHEPGGEAVNGLKIRLTADRESAKPGDPVKLVMSLCNMTDREMNVHVGYSTCGNYFACGATLRRVDGQEKEPGWLV